MNCKERVLQTVSHKETDIVPYSILFTPEAKSKMAAYYQNDLFENQIGNHFAYLDIRPPKIEIKPGYFSDEFGVVWNRTKDKEIGVVDQYLVDADNVDSFIFPDTKDPRRYERCENIIRNNKDKFIVAKFAHALFERAWMLYGMEELLSDMILNPQVVSRLFDRLTEYFLNLLNETARFDGIDCVHYGDDWGQQHGLLMGPKLWRSFIKPRMQEIYQRARSLGMIVYIHSCGDIHEIMPDLIEMGVDICDPFQPEAYDIYELKRQYGNDITYFGGISLQKTLPFGSVTDVAEETASKLKTLSKGGGYIAAPSHAITKDVPPENVNAMIKVLKNQHSHR